MIDARWFSYTGDVDIQRLLERGAPLAEAWRASTLGVPVDGAHAIRELARINAAIDRLVRRQYPGDWKLLQQDEDAQAIDELLASL